MVSTKNALWLCIITERNRKRNIIIAERWRCGLTQKKLWLLNTEVRQKKKIKTLIFGYTIYKKCCIRLVSDSEMVFVSKFWNLMDAIWIETVQKCGWMRIRVFSAESIWKSENGKHGNDAALAIRWEFLMQFARKRHTAIQRFFPMPC